MENPYAPSKCESPSATGEGVKRLTLNLALLIWVVSLSCKFAYEYALGPARPDKVSGWLDLLILFGHLSPVVATVMPIVLCGEISKRIRNFWAFFVNVPALTIVGYVARMLR